MATFAQINNSNVVVHTIAVENSILLDSNNVEQESLGVSFLKKLFEKGESLTFIQCSCNTMQGIHHTKNEQTGQMEVSADQTKARRKMHPNIGDVYDPVNDWFKPAQPFNSWTFDETLWRYVAPVEYPDDGLSYQWDDNTQSWVLV
tara:strand:- start:4587 stop:5024 length:438 start_codon:yes stop_codon:yes gene_type:complete